MSNQTPAPAQALPSACSKPHKACDALLTQISALPVYLDDVRNYESEHQRFAHSAISVLALISERLTLQSLSFKTDAADAEQLAAWSEEADLLSNQLTASIAGVLQATTLAELAIGDLLSLSERVGQIQSQHVSKTNSLENLHES